MTKEEQLALIESVLRDLVKEGIMEVAGKNAKGRTTYRLTEHGKKRGRAISPLRTVH
jgi:DNA-binding PadR family transcriptional regulator